MKRDIALIRDIMLQIENEESPFDKGASAKLVRHHLVLIQDAGFLLDELVIYANGHVGVEPLGVVKLSWQGHEFLDSIRSPEVWEKTKTGMEKVGGWTFAIVKELAVSIIKQQLGLTT